MRIGCKVASGRNVDSAEEVMASGVKLKDDGPMASEPVLVTAKAVWRAGTEGWRLRKRWRAINTCATGSSMASGLVLEIENVMASDHQMGNGVHVVSGPPVAGKGTSMASGQALR